MNNEHTARADYHDAMGIKQFQVEVRGYKGWTSLGSEWLFGTPSQAEHSARVARANELHEGWPQHAYRVVEVST